MKPDHNQFRKLSEQGHSLVRLIGKDPSKAEGEGWSRYCEQYRPYDEIDFKPHHNAGIAGGPASGVIVLDVDHVEYFKEMCQERGWTLPETRTHHTGTDKPHLLYLYPDNGKTYGCRSISDPKSRIDPVTNKVQKVFDIKALGGQVVAPGSIHPDTGKPYRIVKDIPIAPAPQWLLDLTVKEKPQGTTSNAKPWSGNIEHLPISQRVKRLIKEPIPKGARSDGIMSVLNALAWANLSDSDIFAIFETCPIGEKYREKGSGRFRWLEPQIEKARDYVADRAQDEEEPQPMSAEFSKVTPLDIFTDAPLAAKPDVPLDALPPVIAEFAQDEAERLGVTVSMIAMPAIVACAACISDGFSIQPKKYDTSWTENARLWVCCIHEPGGRFTPAMSRALKPLYAIQAEWGIQYQEELKEYRREKKKYEALNKKEKIEIEEPPEPTCKRLLSNDTTIEALGDVLEANPRGILQVRDELTGWLGSFDAYKSSHQRGADRAHWLEAYQGGPRVIDRVKNNKYFKYVPNWSVCIYGGIQPEPMRKLMGQIVDDGLCQRFLPFYGGLTGIELDKRPNLASIEAYENTIKYLIDLNPLPNSETFVLSDEAHRYRNFIDTTAAAVMILSQTTSALKVHLDKWKGTFPRILETYHLIESASRNDRYPSGIISEETTKRAAKLMRDFLLPHATHFYYELAGGEHGGMDGTKWVAGHILAHRKEKITPRDLYRNSRTFRVNKKANTPLIIETMKLLENAGWVTPKNKVSDGCWVVNPKVHTTFAEKAAEEKIYRKEMVTKVQQAAKLLGIEKGLTDEIL